MKRGAWHQFGDKSQKLALEQLQANIGVGVIISSRDLSAKNAEVYAPQYAEHGADILWDPQFYVPNANIGKLDEWEINSQRQQVSGLNQLSSSGFDDLTSELARQNSTLSTTAVIAPAVVYEAGRPDIVDLNHKLFAAAKKAGDELGKPTYASIVLGKSAAVTDLTGNNILSAVTSLDANGWYFAYEFPDSQRLPANPHTLFQAIKTGLRLAMTGEPVLHAFAGPLGLLSAAWGATGAGIGHSQNVWQFTRERWDAPTSGGGGGNAPARHFSDALWGTIVDPDETTQLGLSLRQQILTDSPYRQPWTRHNANKHLVHVVCSRVQELLALQNPIEAANRALQHLHSGQILHQVIRQTIPIPKDNADAHHSPWRIALNRLLNEHSEDYDFLDLIA